MNEIDADRSSVALSVIVVCWNNLDELKRTINSIRMQTFKDLEIVVSDGGSDVAIVSYIEQEADRWRSGPDRGVYDAMNQGLDMSQGSLTLFLNSGDCFVGPNAVAALMAGRGNADYVPGGSTLSGKAIYKHTRSNHRWLVAPSPPRGLPHMSTAAPTAVLRRFRFDERYRVVADIDLWRRMDTEGELQVVTIDETISIFEYGDGLSSLPKNNALKWVENLMIQHKAGQKFTTLGLLRGIAGLLKIEMMSRLPITLRLKIWQMRHNWEPLTPETTTGKAASKSPAQ